MRYLTFLLFYLFFSNNVQSNDIPNDEEYYKLGVKNYKNANFSEAYIIFQNLADKGDRNAQFNVSNMYANGVGITQDFKRALKWSWMCSLGGEKKCLEKINSLKKKLDEKTIEDIAIELEKSIEKSVFKKRDINDALKLGFWYEMFSPSKDLEKAYIWYSVSVSGGLYKAMNIRERVGNQIESENITKLQIEANKIYNQIKYFTFNEEVNK